MLILGIINGGLGLKLAASSPAYSQGGTIAYSVIAGLAGVVLLSAIVFAWRASSGKAESQVPSSQAVNDG